MIRPPRQEVWRILRKLKNDGPTIFLTTHYMEEAEALCDRVCLIRDGVKVAEGTLEAVMAASGKIGLEEAYRYYMEASE